MATAVDVQSERPEWLPDDFVHVRVTSQEIRDELDREAQRLFGMTADVFLRTYQRSDIYAKYAGDPRFNSLSHLADLIAEPAES